MANKEKINLLLTDIKSLEELVNSISQAEIYPVSFFSRSFDLSQKIINQLHILEEDQLEMLREQMEAHKGVISRIKESIKAPVEAENYFSEISEIKDTPFIPPTIEENTTEIIEIASPAITVTEENVFSENKTSEETSPSSEIITTDTEEKNIPGIPQHEKPQVSLIEILEKKNLSDFRKAFSLNDRFRFRRELFKGDEDLMNKVISELNDIDSLELSMEYLSAQFNWDQEEEAVSDFIRLLEKRFL